MIGPREYQALKQLSESLTETEQYKISEYEQTNKLRVTPGQQEYFRKVHQENKDAVFNIDSGKLLNSFYKAFKHIRTVEFDNKEGRLENLMVLINYFSRNPDFFNSTRLCRNSKGLFISEPSFKKGLLIVGDYGCGKSSIFESFSFSILPY